MRPYGTTEEVCQLCAEKFKVRDPDAHALFLLTEESTQQLAPDTHPQKIKAELHSRPQSQAFYFVYRRIQNLNLPAPADEFNHSSVTALAWSLWNLRVMNLLSSLIAASVFHITTKTTVLFWKCLHLKETENDARPWGKKEGRMCLTDAAFSALLFLF